MKTALRYIISIAFTSLVALVPFDTALAQDVISVSPTSLSFCVASTNSPSPVPQTVTVSPVGSSQINYNASATKPWIRLNGLSTPPAISGNTQFAAITVQIDPSGYSGGSNSGQIDVNAASGQNVTHKAIPVNVNVLASCSSGSGGLSANPTTVNLSQSTQVSGVTISGNTGSVTASYNYGNGPAGWFQLDMTASSSSSFITDVSLTTAPSGANYSGSFTFTDNSNSGIFVTVNVNYVSSTGNGAFTATPTSINHQFNTTSDGVFDTMVTIGAGTVTGHNVSANINIGNGPFNWITVPVAPGTVPTNATIRLDPTNMLTNTTYSGSVSFVDTSNNSNVVTIPVTATVGTNGTYSVTPNPLTFTIPGGTSQTSLNATLTGPNGAFATSVLNGNGPSGWFSISPSSSSIVNNTASLTVTVFTSNLISGITYTGTGVILVGGNQVASFTVSATFGGASTLTITPSQLNFAWQAGQFSNPPSTQTISVSSAANTSVTFNVSPSVSNCGSNWLVPNTFQTATNGTSPVGVSISINLAGLPSTNSTCNGNIQITSPGTTANIPVTLQISTSPILNATPAQLTFSFQPGAGTPANQTVTLTSSNSNTQLNFSVNVNPVPSGTQNFLTLNQSNGTTPFGLSVGLNPSVLGLLGPGTYVNNIVITSANAGNSPVTIPVTLTVSGNGSLVVNPTSLTLNYEIGQNQPPNQPIFIASTGGTIQFNASALSSNCGNFLGVSPTSGSTTAVLGQNGTQISASVSLSGLLQATTCSGNITVTAINSSSSVTIPVTVNVLLNQTAINISPASVVKTSTDGVTFQTQSISLTSTDNATQIPFSASVSTIPVGSSWATVFPQTGFTPNTLTVQLNPQGLTAGTYTATLTITDTASTNNPVPTQTVPITFIVAAAATVNPASLTFAAQQNTSALNQTLSVGNVPSGVTIGTTVSYLTCTSTNWLTTTVSGNSVSVGASASNLPVGTCTAQIAIIVPGASNSPLTVPVTFNVTSPQSLTLSATQLTFSYSAGSTTIPQSQTVNLATSTSTNVPFTVSTAFNSGSGFFTVSPTTGNTPQTLTFALNSSVIQNLSAGTYTGTATIASNGLTSVTVNVSLTVTAPPPPTLTTVVNAATQQPGAVSPGEIITIYGTNVGPTTPANLTLLANGSVSTNIGGTQVFFDGIAAPLIYVSATQINLIVPYEIAGRFQTALTVTRAGGTSNAIQLRVTDTAPGIFTLNASGSGQGAVLNQNNSVNGSSNPAAKGSIVSLYATGEGQLNPPGITGSVTSGIPPIPKPTGAVSVNFVIPGPNGTTVNVPATITFEGEAPSLVEGVLQVNFVVPATVPSGAQTVVLTVGANSSPATVTVFVQ